MKNFKQKPYFVRSKIKEKTSLNSSHTLEIVASTADWQ